MGGDIAGGNDAGGGAGNAGLGGGPTGAGSGGDHGELCGLTGSCANGKVTGFYGNFCRALDFTCELGCRTPPGTLAHYLGDDVVVATSLAREALCELPDGGGPAQPDAAAADAPVADAPVADAAATCVPQVVNGSDTGYDACSDGTIRRREPTACKGTPGTPTAGGCWKDADCPARSICICSSSPTGEGGGCLVAGCATGRDCPAGLGCIVTVRADSADTCLPAGRTTFDCQTPDDACSTNADCGDSPSMPRECRLVGGRRLCGCKKI